jgi:hypothetical protein
MKNTDPNPNLNLDSEIRFRGYDRTYTHEEIGAILGISASRVKEIERVALMKLLHNHGRFLRDLRENSTEDNTQYPIARKNRCEEL